MEIRGSTTGVFTYLRHSFKVVTRGNLKLINAKLAESFVVGLPSVRRSVLGSCLLKGFASRRLVPSTDSFVFGDGRRLDSDLLQILLRAPC
jgi:hypothetical protein